MSTGSKNHIKLRFSGCTDDNGKNATNENLHQHESMASDEDYEKETSTTNYIEYQECFYKVIFSLIV